MPEIAGSDPGWVCHEPFAARKRAIASLHCAAPSCGWQHSTGTEPSAMGSFAVPGALPLGGGMHCQFRQRSSIPHSRCPVRSQRSSRLVVTKAKGPLPPDTPKDRVEQAPSVGREWLHSLLSRFGPITEKPNNTAVLDFEKPLVELDNRIKEVRNLHLVLGAGCRRLGRHPLPYLSRVVPGAHGGRAHPGPESRRGERRRRLGVDQGARGACKAGAPLC